ncbi:MAG: hypothetical protein PCFJNLEI_04141 [Verrucomicrobiae bacterium]|nr:hypothetical protein [Verrucomicrobiae bacterium]
MSWIIAPAKLLAAVLTFKTPPLLIELVLLPRPNDTAALNVPPLLILTTALPSELLALARTVAPPRMSIVPAMPLLLPLNVRVLALLVAFVTNSVLPAVVVTFENAPYKPL